MHVRISAVVDTSLEPHLIREALLDFSKRRLEIWAETLDPDRYAVHWLAATEAEVTEGNRWPRVWSRERYDWSDPRRITWTTQESNFCRPGSFIAMEIEPMDGGGSHVVVTWDRTSSNLRGLLWLLVPALGGDRLLAWATRQALARIAVRLGS
jgi:hypothetical protein